MQFRNFSAIKIVCGSQPSGSLLFPLTFFKTPLFALYIYLPLLAKFLLLFPSSAIPPYIYTHIRIITCIHTLLLSFHIRVFSSISANFDLGFCDFFSIFLALVVVWGRWCHLSLFNENLVLWAFLTLLTTLLSDCCFADLKFGCFFQALICIIAGAID